jgi:hypothetical protein
LRKIRGLRLSRDLWLQAIIAISNRRSDVHNSSSARHSKDQASHSCHNYSCSEIVVQPQPRANAHILHYFEHLLLKSIKQPSYLQRKSAFRPSRRNVHGAASVTIGPWCRMTRTALSLTQSNLLRVDSEHSATLWVCQIYSRLNLGAVLI